MKTTLKVILFGMIILLVIGCGIGLPGGTAGGKAAVTIKVGDNVLSGKTVMPSTSLVAGHYAVHGLGTTGQAQGTSFDLDIDTSGTGQVQLLPGGWAFTATVWNNTTVPVAVGSGSATATVIVGTPQTVTMHCVPYDGNGTLAIALSWVPDVIANPGVQAQVKTFAGISTSIPMTLAGSTAANGSASLAAGWYVGALRILDGGVLNAGIVETIRIAQNATSTWTNYLTVNQLAGNITLGTTWAPGLALTLTTTPAAPSTVTLSDTSQTVTITGADNDGGTTLVYGWYKNGVLTALSTSNALVLDPADYGVDSRNYLSATVFQSDGQRAGDAQFVVLHPYVNPATKVIAGTATSTSDNPYTIQLVNVSTGSVVAQSLATDGVNVFSVSFSFANIPSGNYKLYGYRDSGLINGIWTTGTDGPKNYFGGGTGTVITVPIVAGTLFNFTMNNQ